jgi:hypothetical protein
MLSGAADDLLVIASERTDFFDVLQRFPGTSSVEVRLDRRRGQRRREPSATVSDERRQQDRRRRDVDEELRTVGWVFIPADQRG